MRCAKAGQFEQVGGGNNWERTTEVLLLLILNDLIQGPAQCHNARTLSHVRLRLLMLLLVYFPNLPVLWL